MFKSVIFAYFKSVLSHLKCKELRVDFSKQQRTDDAIIVDGQTLEVVKSVKILGVTLRNDLKLLKF